MPRSRRPYGSGSIVDRGGGKWQLRISLGSDPITGEHVRHTRTVEAPNRTAAQKMLAAFLSEQHGKRQGSTLGGLLVEYLNHRPDMSPSTRADYEGFIRRSIPAHMAKMRLRDITPRHLDGLYLHLLREGSADGGPLAAATVHRVHTILHAAFEQAVDWTYLTANPASKAKPPKVEHREVQLPPAPHLTRLLARIADLEHDTPGRPRTGSPLPDFTAVLLGTGARPGELCALFWDDVDIDRARLRIDESVARGQGGAVVKGTKTGKGRWVSVDDEVAAVLAARRARWLPAQVEQGLPDAAMPVFPAKKVERPWRPDSMSRAFRLVRDELDLSEDLTLRNLRHYCVSILAHAGVDVVTAARRHGHSPQVMLKVYAHLIDGADREAANVLGKHVETLRSR